MRNFYFLLFTIHPVLTAGCTQQNVECDKFCTCTKSNRNAICSSRHLNYIPRFPEYIRSVTMLNTNLTTIGKFEFFNLTCSVIKRLNLTSNSVSYIHPDAFSNLSSLITLIVSRETSLNISILTKSLNGMNKNSLKILQFTYNGWDKLPGDMFASFTSSLIDSVHLTGNLLSFVDCKVFTPLTNLSVLQLSENIIQHISIKGLPHIRSFWLDKNRIFKVPEWCGINNSLVPGITHLKLSYNFISELGRRSFRCLEAVRDMWLESVNARRIQSNAFADMPALKTLHMTRVGNPLKLIEDFAFNSSSLEKIILADSRFSFQHKGFNIKTIFAFCPRLISLDLSGNYIPNFDNGLQMMFLPLTKLETLTLSTVRLTRLPKNVFTNLKSLKTLNLANNYIASWNESEKIFGNTSIQYLNLASNWISIINETTFPIELLTSLERLNLAFNRFSCTCNQLWFRDWISRTSIKLVNYPKFYRCRSPNNMNGIRLIDYKPTIESCTPWNPLFTMAISIASSVLVIFGLFFICIKCQTNLKNRLYLLRVFYTRRRQSYHYFEDSMDFEYHAFVVYCDADRRWVHEKFLPKIENEEGMKICVHHRDFVVGEAITVNIDNFLRKSWKVVVVMSNNFAKSEWCQWEVDVVQERRRRHGRDVFLLIMLNTIDSKHMTSQLRTLLESTPHLRYQTGIGENLFWKAAVETLRKPVGHPPVSVL